MRIPGEVHRSRPWRIHEMARGFRLEDAWALPVHGRADQFPEFLEMIRSFDPANADSAPARLLWRVRDRLGTWLDLGEISRPAEGAGDTRFEALPFVPLYETDDEFAAGITNRTVHAMMHLGWVDLGAGDHRAEMAVYVKPRGLFGQGYMALIRPFRHWIVYPALMRQIERQWASRARGGGARRDPPSTRSGS